MDSGNTDFLYLPSEPCVPMNVSVNYNVSAAWVTWSPAEGATSYSVQAVTNSGSSVACTTNTTSCSLHDLLCSRVYNVTVTASNQACANVISDVSRLITGLLPDQRFKFYAWHLFFLYLHWCVSPKFSTLPTHTSTSKHVLWSAHCDCVLAAEQPGRGLRRLLWQPKWTKQFLQRDRHRYKLCCLWADMWLHLHGLGQGFGRAVQQHRQLGGFADIR